MAQRVPCARYQRVGDATTGRGEHRDVPEAQVVERTQVAAGLVGSWANGGGGGGRTVSPSSRRARGGDADLGNLEEQWASSTM